MQKNYRQMGVPKPEGRFDTKRWLERDGWWFPVSPIMDKETGQYVAALKKTPGRQSENILLYATTDPNPSGSSLDTEYVAKFHNCAREALNDNHRVHDLHQRAMQNISKDLPVDPEYWEAAKEAGAYETSLITHNARHDCPSNREWAKLARQHGPGKPGLGELEQVASVCHHLPYRGPLVKYLVEKMGDDKTMYKNIWNQMCPWAWSSQLNTGNWYLLKGEYQGCNVRVQQTTIANQDSNNDSYTFPRQGPVKAGDTVGMIVARVVTPRLVELTYLCAYKRFGVGMAEKFLDLIPKTVPVVLSATTNAVGFWVAMGFEQMRGKQPHGTEIWKPTTDTGVRMMRHGTNTGGGESLPGVRDANDRKRPRDSVF